MKQPTVALGYHRNVLRQQRLQVAWHRAYTSAPCCVHLYDLCIQTTDTTDSKKLATPPLPLAQSIQNPVWDKAMRRGVAVAPAELVQEQLTITNVHMVCICTPGNNAQRKWKHNLRYHVFASVLPQATAVLIAVDLICHPYSNHNRNEQRRLWQ